VTESLLQEGWGKRKGRHREQNNMKAKKTEEQKNMMKMNQEEENKKQENKIHDKK
jgi:hypothetical protein